MREPATCALAYLGFRALSGRGRPDQRCKFYFLASASFLLAHPQLALTYNIVNRLLNALARRTVLRVLVRRVIDLGFVMNRVAVYSALSIVLLSIFVLLEFGISKLFLDTSRTGSLVIQLGIALAIGVSARYLHQVVDRLVDRVLFAKRHANESALWRFAHETEAYTSGAALLDRTLEILSNHSETRGAAIYLTNDGRAQLARTGTPDFPTSVDLDDPLLVKLRRWNEPVDTAEVKTVFPEGMVFPMNARGKFDRRARVPREARPFGFRSRRAGIAARSCARCRHCARRYLRQYRRVHRSVRGGDGLDAIGDPRAAPNDRPGTARRARART